MIIGRGITLGAAGQSEPVAPEKDVNFIDYDGSILYSYTAGEFAALTALPPNPSHSGLTAQGWNWTLADAKTHVASYGRLWIGQMYITTDGKTRIYIRLREGRLKPYLGLAVNGSAVVDWGDGSSTETITGYSTYTVVSRQHTFPAPGDYVISFHVSGEVTLLGSYSYSSQVLWNNSTASSMNRHYQNAIQRVEIGDNCSIGNYAFYDCASLSSITIPYGITGMGQTTFYMCYCLRSVVIPSGMTGIPYYGFHTCDALSRISIPNSVTSIGQMAFTNSRNIKSIAIPGNVTTIAKSAFSGCNTLFGLVLPVCVTGIDNQVFRGCIGLSNISIPANVVSIGEYAFGDCYGLSEIRFELSTPPAVSNSNAWSGVPTDCRIYVPAGSLSAYTSASNYLDPTQYTYIEYSAGA